MVVHLNLHHRNYEWRGCKDLILTFYPEKSQRNKGNFTCGVFHLKDKERGKTEKKLRKRPALMRKREMKMDEDEKG